MFKIKDGYKLELQIPKTMNLFGSTKKIIDQTKTGWNVPSLEVVKIFVQFNYIIYINKILKYYTFLP